jgi:ATP-dependent DNA helicase RecQ
VQQISGVHPASAGGALQEIALAREMLPFSAPRAAANAAALAGDQGDAALFGALRRRRSELAKEQRVAAYVVFADKTLIDMARRKPATVAEMGAVHGVGAAKLRQYGEVFLDVIRQHAAGRP